jgi:hypothetical protein
MVKKRSAHAEKRRLINEQYDRRLKSVKVDHVVVQVPLGVSGQALIKLCIYPVLDSKVWKESAWFVLNAILEQETKGEYKTNNLQGNKKRGFVSINHMYLREYLSQKYTKKILDALVDAKIIDRDGSWQDNVVSCGYRINYKYWKRGIKFRTITSPEIVKRYNKVKLKLLEESKKRMHKHAHLSKWFITKHLKLDKIAAIQYLIQLLIMTEFLIKDCKLDPDAEKEALMLNLNTHKKTYEDLKNWDHSTILDVSIDNSGYRMHTPLTRLLSPVRNFLVHESNSKLSSLVYFDISNSQPFHLMKTINEKFWTTSGKINLNKTNKELWTHLRNKEKDKLKNITMMIKSRFKNATGIGTKGLLPKKGSRTLYSNLVVNGKLYKFISDEFKGKYLTRAKVDRFRNKEAAKGSMMSLLYFNDKNPWSSQHKPFHEFCQLFPEVGAVISFLKIRDYTDFSIILQRIESEILLRIVAKNIFELNSEIPVYSIHDGLVTTKEYAVIVKQEINTAYKRIFGVEPNLKYEELNRNNVDKKLLEEAQRRVDKILTKMD